MKKRLIFIINPVSGGKIKLKFPELADRYIDKSKFEVVYEFTTHAGHAIKLAQHYMALQADIIVAVGGDGTINEVAGVVEGSLSTLGIIPFGSGNGLARSLGIPLSTSAAVRKLNDLHESRIDTGLFNGQKFFNMAGIGFDAHISAVFASDLKRGLSGYVKTAFAEVSTYLSQHYTIQIDGKTYEREAFMVNVANSSQFGNNAHISPFASLRDGLLDICIVKPFPLYQFPAMGFRMFNKSTHKSKYVEIIKGAEIKITRENDGAIHLDGEPVQMGKEINISVKHLSLPILN